MSVLVRAGRGGALGVHWRGREQGSLLSFVLLLPVTISCGLLAISSTRVRDNDYVLDCVSCEPPPPIHPTNRSPIPATSLLLYLSSLIPPFPYLIVSSVISSLHSHLPSFHRLSALCRCRHGLAASLSTPPPTLRL
jgi:hypothetical protein